MQNTKLSRGATQSARKHPPVDDRDQGTANPVIYCILLIAIKCSRREERISRIFFTGSFASTSRSYQRFKCSLPSKIGKVIKNTIIQEGYLQILLPPIQRDFRKKSTVRAVSSRGGKPVTNNHKERSSPSIVLSCFSPPLPLTKIT